MSTDLTLLQRIDAYLDAAPRTAARTEVIGPCTLFLNEGHGWRYYARPTPGASGVTADAIGAVRARQRALAQPEALEWIGELAPEVGPAAQATGMHVVEHPLMVLAHDIGTVPAPDGVGLAIVDADDDLAALSAVAEVGFATPGTASGAPGAAEAIAAAARQSPETIAFQRGRMLAGLTVAAAARVAGVVAAVGWHQPLEGASEIVGVATLPAFRRRGLGAAVTATLVADALERGIELVFLSADDEHVARVYAKVGFERVGTACAASVPTVAGPTLG
jgi:ribosomal protein S18 acetylase RimI-like enzyme